MCAASTASLPLVFLPPLLCPRTLLALYTDPLLPPLSLSRPHHRNDLVSEYQQYQDASAEEEGEFEEEGGEEY